MRLIFIYQIMTQQVLILNYAIDSFCDGILYIPPYRATDESIVGFWALEFKTAASSEFDKVKAAGMPKEEHARQAQIYLWGLAEYYKDTLPLKGAIIYYENRDTLDHLAYEVMADPEAIDDLLRRVKAMLDALAAGRLPDDTLPPEHWGHAYCPYLEICEPGQKAMAWQKTQPKSLPDQVLADIIAKRIVAKKGAEAEERIHAAKASAMKDVNAVAADVAAAQAVARIVG